MRKTASAYVRVTGKERELVFSRKAKNNAALNFADNIVYVLEEIGDMLREDEIMSVRNSAFDYDMLILVSSETGDVVVLDFRDVNMGRRVDIDFSSALLQTKTLYA